MLATVNNCMKELDKTNRVNERIYYEKQLGYNIGFRCIGTTSSRVKSVCKKLKRHWSVITICPI